MAAHVRSLFLNGKWQDISARNARNSSCSPAVADQAWPRAWPSPCSRRTAPGGHDPVDGQARLPWVGGILPARRAPRELVADTCFPSAPVSHLEALLGQEVAELLSHGLHLLPLRGIARGRHNFTGRMVAALHALIGWAAAADPRLGVLPRLDVRAAATFAKPPHLIFIIPAEQAPLQIVDSVAADAVAMDIAAAYPLPRKSESDLRYPLTGSRREIVPFVPMFQPGIMQRLAQFVAYFCCCRFLFATLTHQLPFDCVSPLRRLQPKPSSSS